MNKKKSGIALILYFGFVVWIVLLSRKPYNDAIILPHSKTLHLIFGNESNGPYDIAALNRGKLIIEDILNICLFIPIGFLQEGFFQDLKIEKTVSCGVRSWVLSVPC